MKRLTTHHLVVAGWACALLLLNACETQRDAELVKQDVTFGFNIPETSGAGRTSSEKTDVSAVVITILDANQQTVYSSRKLNLFSFNGKMISEPISLLPGNYSLHEFLVLKESGDVIYATPMGGSAKAYLVNDPLDIDFSIVKDDVAEVTPEVLSVVDCQPQDFGYASFSFEKVETFDFLIAVLAYDTAENKLTLTDATLTVTDAAQNTRLQRTLSAETTLITLAQQPASYFVRVEKAGYLTYEHEFATDELKKYRRAEDYGPLMITLEPGQLVFWNKLGSDSEVEHSEIGPGLYFFTAADGIHVPANHEYSPGKVGNAITIAPGNYQKYDRVHNLVLEGLPEIINPERGTIECYFFQKESPRAFVHNPHRIVDGPYGFLSGMGFMSHDFDEDGQKMALTFYLALGGQSVSVSSMNFDQFNGTWIHVAAVWDRNGIGTSSETMRLYINGMKMASTTATGWGTQIGDKADIAGGNDEFIARQFYVDELKIYNAAKTYF